MEIRMAKFWKAMDKPCVTSAEFLFSANVSATNESKPFTNQRPFFCLVKSLILFDFLQHRKLYLTSYLHLVEFLVCFRYN